MDQRFRPSFNPGGHPQRAEQVRQPVSQMRATGSCLTARLLLAEIEQMLQDWTRRPCEPVINATGVILHTNLGRAPLSQAALQAPSRWPWVIPTWNMIWRRASAARAWCTLRRCCKHLTGAEAALVVNNNAAAVLLALTALARRRAVVIAR